MFRASFVSLIPGVNLLVWEALCVKEEEFLTTWGETAWSSLSSGLKILPSSCVVVLLHGTDGGKFGDSDPTCIIQNEIKFIETNALFVTLMSPPK